MPVPCRKDVPVEVTLFVPPSQMTFIIQTNTPYRIVAETLRKMSTASASSGERHRGDQCQDDRRRDDHRGEDRRRSDRRDAPETDRVSKPSGPLSPFCYRHHAKAMQYSLSMCSDCLAPVTATGTALKSSAMDVTNTVMSPTVALVIPKVNFSTLSICFVSLQVPHKLSRSPMS